MKKALIITTVSGFVPQFEMNNVRILQGMGYEVHYATNYNNPSYGTDNSRLDQTGILRHQVDFNRSPFVIRDNIKVYKQLKKLMQLYKYDLIHCHTPMGAAMARLVGKKTNTRPIFYTAHGFHFYKGAPKKNWLIYYPVEKYLSRYTDVLITINQEDYKRAEGFRAKELSYVPGVGIDYKRINEITVNRDQKRTDLGIDPNATVILSAGELIKRKNYETALRAFATVDQPDAVYLICGHGVLEDRLKALASELGIASKVLFLGYRQDMYEIMSIADIFFFPSYQEGLSVALMEAMACSLPVVVSKIRGNTDLVKDLEGGYLHEPEDIVGFAESLGSLCKNPSLRKQMGDYNNDVIQQYDVEYIQKIMTGLYGRYVR